MLGGLRAPSRNTLNQPAASALAAHWMVMWFNKLIKHEVKVWCVVWSTPRENPIHVCHVAQTQHLRLIRSKKLHVILRVLRLILSRETHTYLGSILWHLFLWSHLQNSHRMNLAKFRLSFSINNNNNITIVLIVVLMMHFIYIRKLKAWKYNF